MPAHFMSFTGARLVRYLLDIGAVDTASVVDGELMVSDSTRRHLNHKVRLRSPTGCFVKQARADQALSQSTLHREAMCYWLAGNDPHFAALAPLLPRYIAYDRARQTLVLELLPAAENLSELQLRLGRVPAETAAGLGLALGRAQAGVRDPGPQRPGVYVFPRTVPWVLNIHALISNQVDRLSAANAHLLAIVRQYPEFPAALDALRGGWRNERLIHGDMKWDNCLVLDGGDLARGAQSQSQPETQPLRVIDWELADFGDGLWDVGGIFHSFLCSWLMSMPPHDEARAEQLLSSARHPIEGMQPAMRAFWHAYLEGAGVASADSATLLTRSMQYAAARMIQTAYEALSYAPSITPAMLRLLQVSLNILTRPGDALVDLFDLSALDRPTRSRDSEPHAAGRSDSHRSAQHDGALVSTIALDATDVGAAAEVNALLRRVADHVQIVSSEALRFGGEPHDLRSLQAAGVPASPYPAAYPLVALLRDLLYQSLFTRTLDAASAAPGVALSDFAQRLSRANASREQWSEGWQVEQVLGEGRVLAQRHGLRRMLWPGEYVLRDGTAMALRAGAAIAVFQPRESHTMQAGFYFAFGEASADEQDDSNLLRVYWNVTATGAIALVASLTRRLNRFAVPFRFKCVNAAEHFGRVDAAVLYTHRRFHRLVRLLLDEVLADLEPNHVRPATPPFTLPLRPGVALAEDPPGGESFGMQRCRLLAEGLWNAFVEQQTTHDACVERMGRHLRDSGLSLQAPHLNPGSRFDYS